MGLSIGFKSKSYCKWVKTCSMYFSAKLSKWHFKRNILGKMKVLRNRCINLCPKKCILNQIPIASQEMRSKQLECFPASSRSRSLGSWNPNLSQIQLNFGTITFSQIRQFFTVCPRDPLHIFKLPYWQKLLDKVLEKWLTSQRRKKLWLFWWEKGLQTDLAVAK